MPGKAVRMRSLGDVPVTGSELPRRRLRLAIWIVLAVVSVSWTGPVFARPKDQDYYTVDQYPELQTLLYLVEIAHVKPVPKAIKERIWESVRNDIVYSLDTFPNHPESLQQLWLYAKLTKSPSFAIQLFEKAVGLFPQYAMTHFIYGAFLTDFNLFKDAERELKRALEIAPNLAIAHVWLAKAYDKSGDPGSAQASAQKAVELGYRGNMLDDILKGKP